MVDTQHFCLRWNNYQSSITSAFENLRYDEDFVDVTLACEGKSLKAHRVVLSACSPYFRELLKSTPCKHPVIVLQDVAYSDLHALVEFIYHGEVNVHQHSLSSFLKTAEVLRVSGLTQQADHSNRDDLSRVRALAAGNNHFPPHDKIPEEGFPRVSSPSTPGVVPTPATMQQLWRRAQIRRNERCTPDIHEESGVGPGAPKRTKVLSPPLNNNDATPADFSMVKNNHHPKVEGNGLHEENSPLEAGAIKCEPLELTGGNGGTGPHIEDSSDSNAAASDRPPASASSNELEIEHPPTPNFLPDSKLFSSTPGTFNFSMAAMQTDHSPLSRLTHGLPTSDLAGTSQDLEVTEEDGGSQSATNTHLETGESSSQPREARNKELLDFLENIESEVVLKTEPLSPRAESSEDVSGLLDMSDDLRANDPGEAPPAKVSRAKSGTYCDFCGKTFSRAWSLQRHLADTHFYVPQSLNCDLCGRNYKSRNSLVSHKSQYHARRKDHPEAEDALCQKNPQSSVVSNSQVEDPTMQVNDDPLQCSKLHSS